MLLAEEPGIAAIGRVKPSNHPCHLITQADSEARPQGPAEKGRGVGYNDGMKKTAQALVATMLLLLPLALVSGCGGEEKLGVEEELLFYAINNILVPERRDSDFLVLWMRKSTGVSDVSPDELGLGFWKWEGGALSEITLEEFKELAAMREGGDPRNWTYSQHSVTVIEVDGEGTQAVVEIGSLYNPLAGSGVRYLLRKEGGEWKKVSEETIWVA